MLPMLGQVGSEGAAAASSNVRGSEPFDGHYLERKMREIGFQW